MSQAPKIPHFIMCIGTSYYSLDEFKKEAQAQGVSRRLSGVPRSLVPGASKIFCAFGAGRDSFPRLCRGCKAELEAPVCAACGHVHDVKKRKPATLDCYFVPDAVEIVLRCKDDAAVRAVQLATGLGLFEAKLEAGEDLLRAKISLASKDTDQIREAVQAIADNAGIECDADLIAAAMTQQNVKLVMTAREPKRGCGYRKHGGVYTVSTSNVSPLIEIDPPIIYDGPHFRGLKELEEDECADAEDHLKGLRQAVLGQRVAGMQLALL